MPWEQSIRFALSLCLSFSLSLPFSLTIRGEKHRNNRVQPAPATWYGYGRAYIPPRRPWCYPDDDASWQPESREKRFLRVTSGHATRIREHGAMRTRSPLAMARMEFDRPHPHISPDLSVTLTLWRWSLTHTPLALLISNIRTYIRIHIPITLVSLTQFITRSFARSSLCILFINSTLPLVNKVYADNYYCYLQPFQIKCNYFPYKCFTRQYFMFNIRIYCFKINVKKLIRVKKVCENASKYYSFCHRKTFSIFEFLIHGN